MMPVMITKAIVGCKSGSVIYNYAQVDFDDTSRVRYLELPPELLYTDLPVTLTTHTPLSEDIMVMRVNSPGMPRCLLSPGLNTSAQQGITIVRTALVMQQ